VAETVRPGRPLTLDPSTLWMTVFDLGTRPTRAGNASETVPLWAAGHFQREDRNWVGAPQAIEHPMTAEVRSHEILVQRHSALRF
jgi:hypothetical protein